MFDLSEDFSACGGPRKGTSRGVVGLDEGADLVDEVLGAEERSASDLALRDEGEPAFDLIEPGGIGRRVMDMEAWPCRDPGPDLGVFVDGIIVDDQVGVEVGRDTRLDELEEAQELLMPVAGAALRKNLAIGDVQGREQCRGAMANVIVGDAFEIAETERQAGLGAFERLDLGFLVDTEHDGMVRRIEIEPDDVPDLVDEQRIRRELEAFRAMRLNAE